LIKEMKRNPRLFLLMSYLSSKALTIWPRAAWSSCGLRHCFRNKSASSLSSSRRILFSIIVSSGLNFNINGWSMSLLPPLGCAGSLASSIFLVLSLHLSTKIIPLRRLIRSLKDRHSMISGRLFQLRFEALF